MKPTLRHFILYCLLVSSPAIAHESKTGYVLLDVRADSLFVTYKFDITDLQRVFQLDANQDRTVDRQELLARIPTIYAFIEDNSTVRLNYLRESLSRLEGSFEQDQAGNMFINFHFVKNNLPPLAALNLHLRFFDAFGSDFKILGRLSNGDELHQMIFTEATPLFKIDNSEQNASLPRQLAAFVLLGMEHIFIGIDHIMFLVGLLIVGGRFFNLVKIVTSFTISHSITLVLAALQIVTIPGWLVESAIALSIVYIAFENFFVEKTDKRWIVTGLFGFVHGFGFANVLGDLGLPSKGLIPSLFAFNVGVEIGQVIIVAVLLPVIWLLLRTKFQKKIVWAGSGIILIFGATWFLDRAFDLPVAIL